MLKDECPVNALRAQNLAGGHFLSHEIRLVFVSLSIWAILGINKYYYPFIVRRPTWFSIHNVIFSETRRCFLKYTVSKWKHKRAMHQPDTHPLMIWDDSKVANCNLLYNNINYLSNRHALAMKTSSWNKFVWLTRRTTETPITN